MAKRSHGTFDTDSVIDTKSGSGPSSRPGSARVRSGSAGRLAHRLDNLRSYLGASLKPTRALEIDARARLSIAQGRVVTRS